MLFIRQVVHLIIQFKDHKQAVSVINYITSCPIDCCMMKRISSENFKPKKVVTIPYQQLKKYLQQHYWYFKSVGNIPHRQGYSTQCFDIVGWKMGRACGLYETCISNHQRFLLTKHNLEWSGNISQLNKSQKKHKRTQQQESHSIC